MADFRSVQYEKKTENSSDSQIIALFQKIGVVEFTAVQIWPKY